jgi:RNA polymerase sigma-70 factor (ECF subfamily)
MDEGNVEEAIRRVREGSVDAYEIVVSSCQGRLRAMISSFCPRGIDPDEIAHLAFVEAFRKIDQYTPNTRFFAWLGTIARLLILVELRKLRREARCRENYLEQAVGQAMEAELEAGAELEEQRVRALRGCVAGLPDHLRQVVQLRYDRDASIENISRKVGRTSGAVKVQLFDIRRKLRECVNRKLALLRG